MYRQALIGFLGDFSERIAAFGVIALPRKSAQDALKTNFYDGIAHQFEFDDHRNVLRLVGRDMS